MKFLLQINGIFFFVLLVATSFSIVSAETNSTRIESLDDAKSVFERQEAAGAAAGTLLKGVGQKIQSGAANLIQGVEHFVVGVLGAINNVNIQEQIQEIVPDDEKTTTEEGEEETTPVQQTTTTTKRTTKRTTMRRLRTKPTTTVLPVEDEEQIEEEATTPRKVFSRKPGYKLKPKSTSPVPSVEDVQVVENQSKVSEKPEEILKTKITLAPTLQQQQVAPQIQYILIPNLQSLYQPGQGIYQQPIYQPFPIQQQQQQPIRTQQIPSNNNNIPIVNQQQQPTILTQPINSAINTQPIVSIPVQSIPQNGQPLKSNEVAPPSSPLLQSIQGPVNSPLNQALPQSEQIVLVLPQQLQPQAQQLFPIQPIVQQQQQQQAVVETTTVPTTTTTKKATTESTKPPSKLQQFSLNRKPSVSRTPKPTALNQVNIPLGTVLRPKEPEYPTKIQGIRTQTNKNQQQRPGLVSLVGGQVPTAPSSNVVAPGEVEGNVVSPGEETGEVVTEEGNEERTETPEETENTDTENEIAAAAAA